MLINTKHFGEIDISEEEILTFPDGIYGFENSHRFALLTDVEGENVFMWLQSIDDGDLCFVVISPAVVAPEYSPRISEKSLKTINAGPDLHLLTIVVLYDDVTKSTVNLQSPIIINMEEKLAVQEVLDSSIEPNGNYKTRHPLFDAEEESC